MEKNNLTVPVAIIVAGLLIAGSLFITRGGSEGGVSLFGNADKKAADTTLPNTENLIVEPVTEADHILGSANAEIFIIEYSDTECPYCKNFQDTMITVMDNYGKTGKVAWVYRHFPLYKPDEQGRSLHSKAGKEAEALECAAEIGGNDKFWEYEKKIYAITPANNGLDAAMLPKIAEDIGLNKAKFVSCLDSGKYAQKVSDSYDAALKAGATGTPYSIILTKDGTKIPISGAQPYSAVKPVLDTLLTN